MNMDENTSEYVEVHGNLNTGANSEIVTRSISEARDTVRNSQSPQRSVWFQQLQRHKKDVILIVLLSIMLPPWDVYSNLALPLSLALDGEFYYALCLLAPQLFNIGMTSVLWQRTEPMENRRWSWILVPLQIWPQVIVWTI